MVKREKFVVLSVALGDGKGGRMNRNKQAAMIRAASCMECFGLAKCGKTEWNREC